MEYTKNGYFLEKYIEFPSKERIKERPVAIIECSQNIPCDPCVEACPFGAITIEGNINSSPKVDFETCTGCGLCLGICPGLAIFLMDLSKGYGLVTIPYELFPPDKGEPVDLLDRSGQKVGEGTIDQIKNLKKHDRTILVTLKMDEKLIKIVRGFRRKK